MEKTTLLQAGNTENSEQMKGSDGELIAGGGRPGKYIIYISANKE